MRKTRTYYKQPPRLPMPNLSKTNDRGFSLRAINDADQRCKSVKLLRQRLEQLKEDANCESVQEEWLAARAVFLLAYLESMEIEHLEGEQINFQRYLGATKTLSDVLNKLGLKKEVRGVERLENYIIQQKQNGTKRRK